MKIRLIFEFRFIGEEATSEGVKCELTESPTWIIDPVDGTLNFVHSFPHSCISIALLVNRYEYSFFPIDSHQLCVFDHI